MSVTALVRELEAWGHLALSSLPVLGVTSWIVWGTLQGGRAIFWPGMCLLEFGTSRSGGCVSWADGCSAGEGGAVSQVLWYFQCAWHWQGQQKFLQIVAVCVKKKPLLFSPGIPWNNFCLCMLARSQIMACWEQCCGNQCVYTWQKGRTFQQELVGWCPGRWGLAALEPGWSPCSDSMLSPPLAWDTIGVSVLCVRADGVTASSVCLRSTAARIQVTRGSRSKYRQSGVFIAVTPHISKLFIVLVLALLLQTSDMMPAQVSYSVLKIRCITCALWQSLWHQITVKFSVLKPSLQFKFSWSCFLSHSKFTDLSLTWNTS